MTAPPEMWKARVAWAVAAIVARSSSPSVRPCDPAQVQLLEREAGGSLPRAYVAFLEGTGAGVGDFMRGSDVDVSGVRRIQGSFRRFVAEMNGPPVPQNAFVFYGHHDYQFHWFLLGRSEDPEVFWFQDDLPEFRATGLTFSQDLLEMVVQSYQVEIPLELR